MTLIFLSQGSHKVLELILYTPNMAKLDTQSELSCFTVWWSLRLEISGICQMFASKKFVVYVLF